MNYIKEKKIVLSLIEQVLISKEILHDSSLIKIFRY